MGNMSNPHHQKLMAEVKPLLGAVWTPYPEDYARALNEAGFDLISSQEASSDGGHQWPLIMQAETFFVAVETLVDFLTAWKMIPGHFKILLERLNRGGKGFIEADQLGLVTTSWQIIAQKRK